MLSQIYICTLYFPYSGCFTVAMGIAYSVHLNSCGYSIIVLDLIYSTHNLSNIPKRVGTINVQKAHRLSIPVHL